MKNFNVSILTPDFSGGGATRAYLLAQVLQKLGCNVKVLGFIFGEKIYPVPPANLEVISVPGYKYPQVLSSVSKLLKNIDGDIVYAVKPRPTSFGVALLRNLQTRCPVILDIDDWELSWYGGNNLKYNPTPKALARDILKSDGALRYPEHPLYLKWMEKFINRAHAITVDTKFLQNRFGGIYLPNGKDTNLFDPNKYDPSVSRKIYGLSQYRVLMFPGTARPHKGLEDILTALEIINQPDIKLVIVGGRDIGDGYIEQLMAKWERWIIRLPQFPAEKMPEIVAAAHLVVVPQRNTLTAQAQFPIKLTDGMAMAKPILSTYVGDIAEILGDTGYVVNPESPEQIATKIQWIFENFDKAQEKGKQARQRCIELYSVDKMASIISEIIANLC
ncbi:glycosyltransferase family 4 protein [Okeanomitos corallinicola TIOX110]|uniref:Glycosyltransferase family 4 protein n=1 Tax=Okeanomitos corallinicola TIOX110 TaxID=3133117 RepID=A0ABZ2UYG1_9CYAN